MQSNCTKSNKPDSLIELAADLVQFVFEVDTYSYLDEIETRDDAIVETFRMLFQGEVQGIRDYLREIISENDENSASASNLLQRMNALIETRQPMMPAASVKSKAKRFLEDFLVLQKSQIPGETLLYCPRCGLRTLAPGIAENALSRHETVYICSACGTDEALRDWKAIPLPLEEWAFSVTLGL